MYFAGCANQDVVSELFPHPAPKANAFTGPKSDEGKSKFHC
jgi:hypothetical protein